MQTQPFSPFTLFLTGCNSLTQYAAATIVKLAEIRCDFSTYQKTSLAALAALRELNYQHKANYLRKFEKLLEHASSLDFYGFCRIPYYFMFSYTADQIDDHDLFEQLKKTLSQNWKLEENNDQLRDFTKSNLIEFLEGMDEKNVVFRTSDQFKTSLKHWLIKALQLEPIQGCDPKNINLTALEIPLAKKTLLSSFIDHIFVAVDMLCVPSFLDGWKLINLGPYAQTIGRFPLLSWVPEHSLDDWVWGGSALGNFLQVILSLNNLSTGKLKHKEKKNEMWLAAVSAAEAFYCYANTQKHYTPRYVNALALIAKSIGVAAFLFSEPPSYLSNDEK